MVHENTVELVKDQWAVTVQRLPNVVRYVRWVRLAGWDHHHHHHHHHQQRHRRDTVTQLDVDVIAKQGGQGCMVAGCLLAELAYKLGRASKYGA